MSAASPDPYEAKKLGKCCRMKGFSTTTVLQITPMLISTGLRNRKALGSVGFVGRPTGGTYDQTAALP